MSTDKGFQGWGPNPCPNTECVEGREPRGGAIQECLTCKGKGSISGDEKLLKYLYENKHHTPFEMAGLTLEIQAPIFVFREWHRHRTQSYNELSARYTALPDMFYMPSEERIRMGKQDPKNKQGSSAFSPEWHQMTEVQSTLFDALQDARAAYEKLLELGVAREVARIVIPVAQYSRMRASANLRNWLHFLSLRNHPAAQWEIQQYAKAVTEFVALYFPRTSALYLGEK